MSALNKDTLLEMYYEMVLIRHFEERSKELFHEKKIGGVYLHLYNGQEATGVGAVRALRDTDHVITAYRDHGIAIARGVDPKLVMAEMYGKKTGVSGGQRGSNTLAQRPTTLLGGPRDLSRALVPIVAQSSGVCAEEWSRADGSADVSL